MDVTPAGQNWLSFFLPAPCLACGRPAHGAPLGLCPACRGQLRAPAPGCAACGRELAGLVPEGFLCGRCRADPPAFHRLIAAYRYQGPLVAVIAGLKYRRLEYLGGHLAAALVTRLEPGARFDLVVPVPLHWWRAWQRGFNQAERIAEAVAVARGEPLVPLLARRRATPTQTRLPRTARRSNVAGAFRVRRGAALRLNGREVLLIDDVSTTGATLGAAARALLEAGAARVTAAVAALTPEPGTRV